MVLPTRNYIDLIGRQVIDLIISGLVKEELTEQRAREIAKVVSDNLNYQSTPEDLKRALPIFTQYPELQPVIEEMTDQINSSI